MSDNLLLIPFQGETLALTFDELREARERGRALMPTTAAASPGAGAGPILLDAEGMERATAIPASWFMEQARRRTLPHVAIGKKYIRFRLDDVLAVLNEKNLPALEPLPEKTPPRLRDGVSPGQKLKLAGKG